MAIAQHKIDEVKGGVQDIFVHHVMNRNHELLSTEQLTKALHAFKNNPDIQEIGMTLQLMDASQVDLNAAAIVASLADKFAGQK